ncbi:hypothetical protein OKW43_001232 [Paraburkholderia sp. WC7.3g]|uniref:hypothetical protein n=1 Tax=Paraburkholderia TaxID=1822464 RepID=UPI0016555CC5|nr:hypothetical protein [Paraburkholderia podalyriae]
MGLTYLRAQWPKLIRCVENDDWPIEQSPQKRDWPVPRRAPRVVVLGQCRRGLMSIADLDRHHTHRRKI